MKQDNPRQTGLSRSKAEFLIEKQVGCTSTGAFLKVLEGKTLLAFEVLARQVASCA